MQKRETRLISPAAASKILQISLAEIERLAVAGTLTRHSVQGCVNYFDFGQVVKYRERATVAETTETPTARPVPYSDGERHAAIARDVLMKRKIERELIDDGYQRIERDQIVFFGAFDLYSRVNDEYLLYKPTGRDLPKDDPKFVHAPTLYLAPDSRARAMKEVHDRLNAQLRACVDGRGLQDVKAAIIDLLDFALIDSAEQAIDGLENTVEILVTSLSRNQNMVFNLLSLIEQNRSLVHHSTRAMAHVMRFCFKNNYSMQDTKLLSLSALLHDIGITQLPEKLTGCDERLLCEADRVLYQSHTSIGFELLKECGIASKFVKYGAIEHHERLDGSGYPSGARKISLLAQLIGIVDTYDLECGRFDPEGHPRSAMHILKDLKKDCERGKFNRELFGGFVYTLI
jgi:putative nucleotidyltransferase with HDIG domain